MIEIAIDKPRHLMYDVNALSDADARLGHNLVHILASSPVALDVARVLLWAGLKHEDPLMTVEKAGKLMDVWVKSGKTPVQMAALIQEAIEESGYFQISGDGSKNSRTS
jgi:hypothetical protein